MTPEAGAALLRCMYLEQQQLEKQVREAGPGRLCGVALTGSPGGPCSLQ